MNSIRMMPMLAQATMLGFLSAEPMRSMIWGSMPCPPIPRTSQRIHRVKTDMRKRGEMYLVMNLKMRGI